MLNAIWWLVTVEAVGLAAFPLAHLLLPRLRDKGYSLSKPLGILLVGYASWILSQAHVLPSVRLSLIALLAAMAGLSVWYAWRHLPELRELLARERVTILAAEGIFLLFFIGWTLFRAYDPAIDHTEQPMDLMLLNASIETHTGAPEDLWLRGEPVRYYYFGYWMMGAITQISGVPSNVSYNLAMASIPALAAAAVFGLVASIISAQAVKRRYAVLGGLAATLLLGIAANLEGLLEFMKANAIFGQRFYDWVRIDGLGGPAETVSNSWMPGEFWWWFRATRVINTFDGDRGIDYTIQEFPFFSFILGDLHPHVMAVPFALLFVALCWNHLRSPTFRWRGGSAAAYLPLLVLGLVLGGLSFVNMWDLPTYAALFLVVVALKAHSIYGGSIWSLAKRALPVWGAVLAVGFVLYLPYFVSIRAGVSGIGVVSMAADCSITDYVGSGCVATARTLHTLIVWGLLLVAAAPFILAVFWQTLIRDDWRRLTAISLLAGFLPYLLWAFLHLLRDGPVDDLPGRLLHILPLALLVSVAAYGALWTARWRRAQGTAFSLALASLGLLLIMGPELMYVDDGFGPPSERMNTIFKLYYQAWVLLAVASGFAVYYWRSLRQTVSGWGRSLSMAWACAFIVLLAGSLYFAPAAAASRVREAGGDPTLDGLAFVGRARPAEYEAIRFLRDEAPRGSGISEAVGEWSDAGLISRSTGIPTVFNWPGHQVQWRGSDSEFGGRAEDVARIYQTQDVEEARSLLRTYDVEYVYVGPRETAQYGTEGLAKFSDPAHFRLAFHDDDVYIYHVR